MESEEPRRNNRERVQWEAWEAQVGAAVRREWEKVASQTSSTTDQGPGSRRVK